MSVRVRFSPSPTGQLHLGSARTALFDYLYVRNQEGTFIIRIEDTDQRRMVAGSVEEMLEGLAWLGIIPDEGVYLENGVVKEKGHLGPYTQSQRLSIYKEYAGRLLEKGTAYRCFCSSERLEQLRGEQAAQHLPPRYDRHCRDISPEESARRAETEPFVIRQKMPDDQQVKFQDVVRGEITFQSSDLDDQVLLKSDGFPTYQLANVVDDHLMQITHVLRGEEWISSTPKNLLLYTDFGWEPPLYAHLPLILGPDKAKLSKRHGAEPLLIYKDRGYLPEAMLNFLAFLGWSPGTEEEFFKPEELAKHFILERVQKAPAIFNQERLDYVNGWYIRQLPVGAVVENMLPYLQEVGLEMPANLAYPCPFPEYLLRVAGAVQPRLKHFDETVSLTRFFFERPTVSQEILVPKKSDWDTIKTRLLEVSALLESQSDWSQDALEEELRLFLDNKGYPAMEVLWPIRAALTGVPASPGAFEMLSILGKEESLLRLRAVVGD